jgi:hypothetical protein
MMKRLKSYKSFLNEDLSADSKMNFYLRYYQNLTPQDFTVTLEGDSIVIRKKPQIG